jgi:hypothetical protein
VIRTLPLRLRNRLADVILAAVHDPRARATLRALADDAAALERWLEPPERAHAPLLRQRARAASEALGAVHGVPPAPALEDVLVVAAALFDAGLGYEVHEMLEPHWRRAEGEEREALQGLIQIAVGYQHLANGNRAGARALLAEGAGRLDDRRLRGLIVVPFARAARAAARGEEAAVPAFPRAPSPG